MARAAYLCYTSDPDMNMDTNGKKIKQRWADSELAPVRQHILSSVKGKRDLRKISSLPQYNEKIDLRGFEFLQPEEIEAVRGASRKKNFFIEDAVFENVDFSNSDLSYIRWSNCTFRGCLFHKVSFAHGKMEECDIADSVFTDCDFKSASLGLRGKKGGGTCRNVSFTKCKFKDVIFYHLKMEHCRFDNVSYDETFFNGARLSDCVFTGEIREAVFRGYHWLPNDQSFIDKLFTRRRKPEELNRMVNVDFRNARFGDVTFSDGIDLSTCLFPEQENYIKIANTKAVFAKVKEIIGKQWSEPYREKGLSYIDKVLYSEDKQEMSMDYLYTGWLVHNVPEDFYSRIFGLIRKMSS